MKRSEIIRKLISEHGFTERTLVHMDDSQITMLGKRIIGEQVVPTTASSPGTPAVNIPKTNKPAIDQAMRNKETFLTYEGDVAEEKKNWIKDAIHPSKKGSLRKTLGAKDGEPIPTSKLNTAAKKGGVTGERARLAKTLKKLKENKNVKSWIKGLVENEYHPLTSKGEIVELVRQRINEVETMQPMPKHKPKKGHNGIPEWLSYKAIKGNAEPATKPVTKPTTEPGTTPTPQKPPRKDPFKPGIRINPKPKAHHPNHHPISESKPVVKKNIKK
jgi:hypothetical protein